MSRRFSDDAVRRLVDLAQPLALTEAAASDDASGPIADYGDKFDVVREIGRGGMGVVYEVSYRGHESLRAALKVLATDVYDFEVRQRFADEARMAATLSHPNIPRIYEIHSSYIAMQLIHGRTLSNFANADRIRVVRLLRDACLATHYAHQQGLVHRDIKPQNLMVTEDDQVFVMDFGLAKRLHGRRSFDDRGRVLGTPVYMAPEQAAGRDDLVDPRSDVYSLGATLYQLLADKPPFLGTSRDEILQRVMKVEPMPLVKAARDLDPALGEVVMACLCKDREARPASAYALSMQLSDWLLAATSAS